MWVRHCLWSPTQKSKTHVAVQQVDKNRISLGLKYPSSTAHLDFRFASSRSRVKTFPGKIKKYPQPCVTPRCRKTVLVPSREIRREICPGVPSLESNQANQERRSAPSSPPAGPPGIPETRELRTRILALLCIRARARAHLVPAPDRARETNTDLIVC